MDRNELAAKWEEIQIKTFTKWMSSHLSKKGVTIENLLEDLKSGVNLVLLLEVISEETFPYKWNKKPKMRIHMLENVQYCLQFIADHDVKLANIGNTAIVDGDRKLTLGMVWTIILRFAIKGMSEEGLSAKQGLLLWCQRKTKPYDNVNVEDFTMSFKDGLAFCALIHAHRPDLIDYESLSADNMEDNLNLAFDVAEKELDVPRLLDAEDIVGMPRPDERSIMTYVAQLYNVFSKFDQLENAGKKLAAYCDFVGETGALIHDYEERARMLVDQATAKAEEFRTSEVGDTYDEVRGHLDALTAYKRSDRRAWIKLQNELVNVLGTVQVKLRSMGRPAYVPPEGLATVDIDANIGALREAESARRAALSERMREVVDGLCKAFADPANDFYEKVTDIKMSVGEKEEEDLEAQLAFVTAQLEALEALKGDLPSIQEAEAACEAANISMNPHTIHEFEDLEFEHEQVVLVYEKNRSGIEAQIAANAQSGVSPEQIAEFRKTFDHFDENNDGSLSPLEFRGVLSAQGVIAMDLTGESKEADDLFKKVGEGSDSISFEQFCTFMTEQSSNKVSTESLGAALDTLAQGKEYVTKSDLHIAKLSEEQIETLTSQMPPHEDVEDAYAYKAWLASL